MKSINYHYLKVRKRTIGFFLAGCIFALIGLGSYYLLTVRKGNQGKEIISPVIEVTPTPTSTPTEEVRKPLGNTSVASWYGTGENECLKCHKYYDEGGLYYIMANGERLDDGRLTVAHKTIPLGTKIKFLRDDGDGSGLVVEAVVADRGPYVAGISWDFSKAVWSRLGGGGGGRMVVRWEVVEN